MQLKGKETFSASAQQIWDIIMDKDKLAAITPGLSRLEELGNDEYQAITDISIGPVKGEFKGDLKMVDKIPPKSLTLKVNQTSKIGNADVTVHLHIEEVSDLESTLSFKGLAKMSGVLARMGQRVMTGVAASITKQLFASLREEVQKLENPNS